MFTPEELRKLEKLEENFKESVNSFAYRMIKRFGEKHMQLILSTIQQYLDDCGSGVPGDFPFDRIIVAIAKKTGSE